MQVSQKTLAAGICQQGQFILHGQAAPNLCTCSSLQKMTNRQVFHQKLISLATWGGGEGERAEAKGSQAQGQPEQISESLPESQ